MSNIQPLEPSKEQINEDNRRLPLAPSEKNNGVTSTNKLRVREVNSRYMSGLSATPLVTSAIQKQCPSPTASSKSYLQGETLPKRPQSAERRRPTTPTPKSSASLASISRSSSPSFPSTRSTTPARNNVRQTQDNGPHLLNNRKTDGLWPSMRNLSSSFQSDPATHPASKKEAAVGSSKVCAKSSERLFPLRRSPKKSDQSENTKPVENSNRRVIDRHLWPTMLTGKTTGNILSKSVNQTEKMSTSTSTRGVSPKRATSVVPVRSPEKSLTEVARRLAIDGSERPRNVERSLSATRPIRALSLDRLEQDVKLGVSMSRHQRSLSTTRPIRAQSSPITDFHHPSSPVKPLSTSSSISRALLNPSRSRPSNPALSFHSIINRVNATSPAMNFLVDVQKGKKNANYIEDVHLLRLLRNVELQLRFANAQTDDTLMIQRTKAENVLQNVAESISNKHESVILKRIIVQHLQQEMKSSIILKHQMAYLERWEALEKEQLDCLSGAIQALQASTLRLPLTGVASADIVTLENCISSSVNVMQTTVSSICSLARKVEDGKDLFYELSAVAAKEKFMLQECRELLGLAAAFQVQESSIRTQLIQLRKHSDEVATMPKSSTNENIQYSVQ